VQIVLIVALYLQMAEGFPLEVHQGLYAISLCIKDILLWIFPVSTIVLMAHTISSFKKQAPIFIISLFLFEFLSNSMSVWYAFICGHLTTEYLQAILPIHLNDAFDPLWRIPLSTPSWWTTDKGVFIGMGIGLIAIYQFPPLTSMIIRGKVMMGWLLTRLVSPLIPLFILGFMARMYQTGILSQMLTQYASSLFWLLLTLSLYIVLLFLVGSGFSIGTCVRNIKNLLPAAGIAFSSGCSFATMPWTIEGTAKNLETPDLAKAVIPATTNIQQIGDCITNAFFCFVIYFQFNGYAPSLSIWGPFTVMYVMTRFGTTAVGGGAILILIPIYEIYLGFNAQMITLILAFNVLLDPIITTANVLTNAALCRIFERIWIRILQYLTPVKNTIEE
jgi:hypothetical protein